MRNCCFVALNHAIKSLPPFFSFHWIPNCVPSLFSSIDYSPICPPCDNEMKTDAMLEHMCASEFGKRPPKTHPTCTNTTHSHTYLTCCTPWHVAQWAAGPFLPSTSFKTFLEVLTQAWFKHVFFYSWSAQPVSDHTWPFPLQWKLPSLFRGSQFLSQINRVLKF